MPTQHKTAIPTKVTPQASGGFRILRMKNVVAKTNLCDSTIYDLISKKQFPPPFKLVPGGRAAGWLESTIDAWATERATQGDAK